MADSDILQLLLYVSAGFGAALAIWQFGREVVDWLDYRVTWGEVEKAVDHLVDQIQRNEYAPDGMFAMGRGGAVMAGLMSGRIVRGKNVPIYMVDREMKYIGPNRTAVIHKDVLELKDAPRSVLLLAGVNASGGTLSEYRQWLAEKGVKEIKSCVIVESLTAKSRASFYYKRYAIDPRRLKMPWYHEGRKDWDQ